MLEAKQIDRVIRKLERFCKMLEGRVFVKAADLPMSRFETLERFHQVPDAKLFTAFSPGESWGGEGKFCWERGTFTPGGELAGKRLYVYPRTTRNEGMLWVAGEPFGIFSGTKEPHADHYCALITLKAETGKPIDIAFEWYAGHEILGTQPFENNKVSYACTLGTTEICVKDEELSDFCADLAVAVDMEKALDNDSFRRADIQNTLLKVHQIVYADPDNVADEEFRRALRKAAPLLKDVLKPANSGSVPFAGLVGHSHLDTAWLWPIEETLKKCARTYSNQISLMEQYPEYLFVQSSAYHTELIRRNYPQLFERIKEKALQGRYEPNGAVWVECDCNIASGETMVRQFLWGQRYTREHFGFTSDAFWLPDTFGYNAAIPQIMRLAGVRYFLTTKISWNDTNQFPYDTFYWQGIDGSRVLTHFNQTHLWPLPSELIRHTTENIREKNVSRRKLFSFGFGDGGGGPYAEMLEIVRRIADTEGVPRTAYTTVSAFMQELEKEIREPSVYAGELYLEIHRGTQTNQHQIKRNNRLAEIAIRDLEYAEVRAAAAGNREASGAEIRPLLETLLVNQFHDILPGTCIPAVHKKSIADTSALIAASRSRTAELLGNSGQGYTLTNTLSFDRSDVFYLDQGDYELPAGARQQKTRSLLGGKKTAIAGFVIPALSSRAIAPAAKPAGAGASPFSFSGNKLETPFALIRFAENGTIDSFLDKTAGNRELRGEGFPLGTLLMAEDVSLSWDNWDIDADIEYKFQDASELLERSVVSDGEVEFRIRSKYRISPKSTVEQDLVFYSDSPLVLYETKIDWHDQHRFLKAAFDTTVFTPEARHEIQFGYIRRPAFHSTSLEKAKFEVTNHKYTDLSESRYGAAVLNDSKYGVSVKDSRIRLSLHKGGNRPDYTADEGLHECRYAFLPHNSPFSAESVVHPAYTFNHLPVVTSGKREADSLFRVDAPTVIAEAVKPCEDTQRAYIVRLYECEGSTTPAVLDIPGAKEITETNLLEEPAGELAGGVRGSRVTLCFRPFEIKTLKVSY
ncbi:MAG: glycosyl hydrolase-related protein [Treponema sp.]|jgi:alpha-mannosidase|nr:glycosyl hydrolase-related protein [Treponema sp.]